MTTHLVTFSDSQMERSAQLCVQSAERVGGVNDSLRWTQEDLKQTDFYRDNRTTLDNPKGAGLWAWKPQIIDWAMRGLVLSAEQFVENSFLAPRDGDIFIYSDAGVEFINNVNYVIDRMGHEKPQDDVWLFGNNWEHAHWCKRDVVDAIFPPIHLGAMQTERGPAGAVFAGKSWNDFGKQVQASVIFFRVSDYTRQFVAEWLKWCLFEGGRLIDDSPSRLPNHPEFREHRHDQAILTTLAYREGCRLHYWPAMYNDGAFTYEKLPEYAGDTYPAIFHHHRRRNHEWSNAA